MAVHLITLDFMLVINLRIALSLTKWLVSLRNWQCSVAVFKTQISGKHFCKLAVYKNSTPALSMETGLQVVICVTGAIRGEFPLSKISHPNKHN
jgi:hypothetical protein